MKETRDIDLNRAGAETGPPSAEAGSASPASGPAKTDAPLAS